MGNVKFISYSIAVIIMILMVSACADPMDTEDYYVGLNANSSQRYVEAVIKGLRTRGLVKEHMLEKLTGFMGVSGKLDGSFTLGFGSIDGSISSEGFIICAWSHRSGQFFVQILPISKVEIFLRDSYEVPTVRYQYALERISEHRVGTIPLGELLRPPKVRKATIRISRRQMEEEGYLFWKK